MQLGPPLPEDTDLSATCTSLDLLWGCGQCGDVRLLALRFCSETSFPSLRQISFPGKLRDNKKTKFYDVKSTRLEGRLDLGKAEGKLMWQQEHVIELMKEDRLDQAAEHSTDVTLDRLSLVGRAHGLEVWWLGLAWRHKGVLLPIGCECSHQCAW